MGAGPFTDLAGRNALITGASSGLGRHFALTLARAGVRVAIAARRAPALRDLAEEIAAFDGRALPIVMDVCEAESVRLGLTEAETELGRLSVVVNNAGIALTAAALEVSEADFDRVLATNLKGAWLVAQESGRHMAAGGEGGSIINIASILGLGATGHLAAYCASKAGLINLTKALALEWAREGIRVNALAPGYIETDINREYLSSSAGENLRARIPQRRFGRPADLDGALLLLASNASSFMTGSVIVLDGGQTIAV